MGLLFFLLFFIFAALGVELFGRLECSEEVPCQGLGEHAHFANFGMAFLTLFRVATGDNWNGIMKDTLRDECDDDANCVKNCCVSPIIAPIFFVIFVLMAQFVLVNVVVAVLMKHLEESHKQMEEDDLETELENEIKREQMFEEEQALCKELEKTQPVVQKRPLTKVASLPSNFTYSAPVVEKIYNAGSRRQTLCPLLGNSAAPLSLLDYNKTPTITKTQSTESKDKDFASFNDSVASTRRFSRPMNRKNLLNKFRTQSFDVQLLETSDSVELDSQSNFKLGQSSTTYRDGSGSSRAASAGVAGCSNSSNNPIISKKSLSGSISGNTSRRLSYRQSSLDFDNRSRACKNFIIDNHNSYNINNNNNNNSCITMSSSLGLNSSLNNKSSFLAVPNLQASARNRSGSTKQLFLKKQVALDEDEQIGENSLLLSGVGSNSNDNLVNNLSIPIQNTPPSPTTSSSISIPQIQLSPLKVSSVNSSTNSIADAGIIPVQSDNEMITLTVDLATDGNVKKSESSELLRIISERRKL